MGSGRTLQSCPAFTVRGSSPPCCVASRSPGACVLYSGHTLSGSLSPVAVCQRAALLIGLPPLLLPGCHKCYRFDSVRLSRKGATLL